VSGSSVVVTCEHATRAVPASLRAVLARAGARRLAGHEAWDPGALHLARHLARALHAPLIVADVSRLVVDANRSERHPRVFSRWTAALPADAREHLLARHHRPFREATRDALAAVPPARLALHLSCHSFTSVLAGVRRETDIALLYDPSREPERTLCTRWLAALRRRLPHLACHANRPYRGTSDGHTTDLRRRLPAQAYAGVEIEVNQRLLARDPRLASLSPELLAGLEEALAGLPRAVSRR
jgi:predicted N-formylglutamate amidohydrolase